MKPKIVLLFAFFTFSLNAQVPNMLSDPKWDLVFEDEFNGTEVDTLVWKAPFFYITSPDSTCLYDNTRHAYVKQVLPNDNVIVDNGILTLIVKELETPSTESMRCNFGNNWPVFDTDVTYTNGALHSIDFFQYGYYEIKFRVPNPASGGNTYQPFGANFWLYNGASSESCNSELDIFEIIDGQTIKYSSNSHNTPLGSAYCDSSIAEFTEDGSMANGFFGIQNISGNTWHKCSAHWTPEKIDYYLDDKLIKTNHKTWVSNFDPMFIILDINAPLGRNNSNIPLNDPSISFPYNYDIDYVRIYKPNDDCGTNNKVYCSTYPPATDGYVVQKSITFGGSSCGEANYPNITNSFYANDYILIDENTTLGGGTGQLFLEVHSCY